MLSDYLSKIPTSPLLSQSLVEVDKQGRFRIPMVGGPFDGMTSPCPRRSAVKLSEGCDFPLSNYSKYKLTKWSSKEFEEGQYTVVWMWEGESVHFEPDAFIMRVVDRGIPLRDIRHEYVKFTEEERE